MYHGSKLPLLKQALKNLKKARNDDTIIMFSDAYDVRIFKDVQTILKTFKEFDANVVFGAEYFYAPQPEILKMYPLIANGGTYNTNQKYQFQDFFRNVYSFTLDLTFLNSGFFIGYLKDIYPIVSMIIDKYKIKPTQDDQEFFHYIYLDEDLREKHNIKLDHNSKLVFNLYGIAEDARFQCVDGSLKLFDAYHQTYPLILHANGVAKKMLPWLNKLEEKCERSEIKNLAEFFKIPEEIFHRSRNFVFRKFLYTRPWENKMKIEF